MRIALKVLPWSMVALLATGCSEPPPEIVGQLLSERVELAAESSEAIIAIAAAEGASLQAGDAVLVQDEARLLLQLQELQAAEGVTLAQLAELENGPRRENLDAARLRVADAGAETDFRQAELSRLQTLRERSLTSAESVELAARQLEAAQAEAAIATLQLEELENGYRPEQLEQARQRLAQVRAQQQRVELERQRLTVRAPVAGQLDSLPLELGERPRPGEVVAVLLTGVQPLARVYVPESLRLRINVGDQVPVVVDGLPQPLQARVRWIAGEAAFTPYFALTERERGRLSYLAELSLPESAQRLPEGLPVRVVLGQDLPGE